MDSDWPFPATFRVPPGDADRLLIADALESADPARAEFIRLQIEIENTPRRLLNKSYLKLQSDLIHHHGARWAGALATQVLDYHYSKGFIHRIICRAGPMLEHGEAWLERHPIRDLTLVRENLQLQTGVQALPAQPFEITDFTIGFFDHPLMRLAECLDLGDFPLSDSNWSRFFAPMNSLRLQSLTVSRITSTLAQLLTRQEVWHRLTHLRATRDSELEGVKILCRAVGTQPTKGPKIILNAAGMPAVREMILQSLWAKRFSFRE